MTIICPWCGKEVGLTTSPLSEGTSWWLCIGP